MSEAFNAEQNSRFKLKKKKARAKKPEDGNPSGSTMTNQKKEEEPEFAIDDGGQPNNGYIINEDGNIIIVGLPKIESLNKYAYNVI